MNTMDELTAHIMGAVRHAMEGNGPASVRVIARDGGTVVAVVFIVPGPVGEIVDEALDKLYAVLGWTVARGGKGEV